MNKRLTCILVAVLLGAAGCSEKADVVYTCGNGILEDDEICDGMQFSENLNLVCSNGATANKSALRCNAKCQLDMSAACNAVCGNGMIEGDEQCDGLAMPTVNAACTNPDLTKLVCQNCRIVDNGICGTPAKTKPAWYAETCGNGQLDGGEICDGDIIASTAKICPTNMIPKGNPVFKCLDSCRGVDISGACVFGNGAVCGNGVLEGDEACDGTEFNQNALNAIQCGTGEKLVVSNAVCHQCQIESACVPAVRDDVGMIISEAVPHIFETAQTAGFDGIALEFTNMSKESADTSTCSLALISEQKIEQKFALSGLNASSFDARESKVLCVLKSGDVFNGACDSVLDDNYLLEIADVILDDMLHSRDGNRYLLGIVCGNDEIVDLMNLNSFVAGVAFGGVDFVRFCDVDPVTKSENALMGEGWSIESSTVNAPDYGLGSHCSANGQIKYCQYTVSRNTLDNRGQAIDLALEINIPGVTDKTASTDVDKSLQLKFIAGEVRNGTKVKESAIHHVDAHPDMEWQNNSGVDRYVGKLRNWDLYEGFLAMDVGTYTLEASISLDNGNTYYYCGPKGLISDYGVYNPEQRNTLVVSYDDEGGVCGDGIISASEICDGKLAREEALECANPGEVVVDPSKITCSNCGIMSTVNACSAVPATCGNGQLDTGEVCDGSNFPESAKTCPKSMVVKDKPDWHCDSSCLSADFNAACEYACGNGKLEEGEVCDSGNVPESAKVCPKDYVPLASPKWECNAKCSGIATETSCELACGNGKIDANEVCDGSQFDHVAAAAKCKDKSTYDESRATCMDNCKMDTAACVPEQQIVFDEFIVQRDSKGRALGVAISIVNYGAEAVEVGPCSISVLNAQGSYAVNGASAYSFLDLVGAEGSSYKLEPCQPIVVCSEPMGSQSEYQDIWGEHCDVVLGGYDSSNKVINNLFLNYPDIDTLQISCGGVFIDYFDFEGFRKALKEGNSHGKLKTSDQRPWPSRTSVDMSKRMDIDATYDIDAFASPVCTN